jgi:hypothetical protein
VSYAHARNEKPSINLQQLLPACTPLVIIIPLPSMFTYAHSSPHSGIDSPSHVLLPPASWQIDSSISTCFTKALHLHSSATLLPAILHSKCCLRLQNEFQQECLYAAPSCDSFRLLCSYDIYHKHCTPPY